MRAARRGDEAGGSAEVECQQLRPLMVYSTGLQCVAWSHVGQHGRHAHLSEALVVAWVQERKALAARREEDVWFLEQVPQFPWQSKVKRALEKEFGMAAVVTGPQYLGEPHLRTRLHAAGWNNATKVCLGQPEEQIEADFLFLFHRYCVLDGAAFLVAAEEGMHQEHKRL